MKNRVIWSVCLLFSAAVLSCQKDQALVNKIEGTYAIEKAIYITSKGDSVVSTPNSRMVFEDCNLRKQDGPQQCNGYYKVDGIDIINFNYRPEEFGGREKMVINIGDARLKPFFGGSYLIEDRTENSLTLIRFILNKAGDEEYNLRIMLKK